MRCGALSITTRRPRSSVKLKGDEAWLEDEACADDVDGKMTANMPAPMTMHAPIHFKP
jgi:hypothetical protein